jgi:hypothetical protein
MIRSDGATVIEVREKSACFLVWVILESGRHETAKWCKGKCLSTCLQPGSYNWCVGFFENLISVQFTGLPPLVTSKLRFVSPPVQGHIKMAFCPAQTF